MSYSIIKQIKQKNNKFYYEIVGTSISDLSNIKDIATGTIFYDLKNKAYSMAYYESGELKWQPQ